MAQLHNHALALTLILIFLSPLPHHTTTRFTAIVRIGYVDYPTKEELTQIYGNYLQAALSDQHVRDDKWRQKSNLQKLAKTMIEIYNKVIHQYNFYYNTIYLPHFSTRLSCALLLDCYVFPQFVQTLP